MGSEFNDFGAACICALGGVGSCSPKAGPVNLLCPLHPMAEQGNFGCQQGLGRA